jgi:hypothetical protein
MRLPEAHRTTPEASMETTIWGHRGAWRRGEVVCARCTNARFSFFFFCQTAGGFRQNATSAAAAAAVGAGGLENTFEGESGLRARSGGTQVRVLVEFFFFKKKKEERCGAAARRMYFVEGAGAGYAGSHTPTRMDRYQLRH